MRSLLARLFLHKNTPRPSNNNNPTAPPTIPPMTPPERVFPSFTPLPFSEARESPDRPVELGLEVLERSVAEGAIGVDDVEVRTLDELDDIRVDEDEGEEAAEEEPGFVVTVDTTTAGL